MTTHHCPGSSHCAVNGADEVSAEVVCEASRCVGDYLATQVKTITVCPERKTAFDATTEPLISVASYFARICTYSRITPETIICSYINLKKVVRDHPQFELTNFNSHRLLVASMMVFSKYYDDDIDSNARWARIAGVAIHELNCLEVDFLNLCQFDLRVSYEMFHNTVHELLCFHHHEPIRTSVPLFNPTATFYRPSQNEDGQSQAAPSPPCAVMTTPRSRYSLANFTKSHSHHHGHHSEHDHSHDNSTHGDESSEHSHSHRRKSLAILMNLFHRHKSHGHHGHHDDHHASHVQPNCDSVSVATSNEHCLHFNPQCTPSVSSRITPPTSPAECEANRMSTGKGMHRNHSTLSLSGLMHALSPTSKPFSRKNHNLHQLEPEVDK